MDNTVCFLRFESSTDDFLNNVVNNTNVSINKTTYIRGDSSAYFNGSAYLEIENTNSSFNFATNELTLELLIRFNSIASTYGIIDFRKNASEVAPYLYFNHSTGKIVYYVNGSSRITSDTSISADTWYHIELSKYHNTTRLFINGTMEGSMYVDNNSYIDTLSIFLGSDYLNNNKLNAYVNDFRISDIGRHYKDFYYDFHIPWYSRTTASYYNVRDLNRVNYNINALNTFMTTGTLPFTYTNPDNKTFGKASLINGLEENINSIKDYLGYDPADWITLNEAWLSEVYTFIYTNANNLEEDLYTLYVVFSEINNFFDKYKCGSSRVICGGGFPIF